MNTNAHPYLYLWSSLLIFIVIHCKHKETSKQGNNVCTIVALFYAEAFLILFTFFKKNIRKLIYVFVLIA